MRETEAKFSQAAQQLEANVGTAVARVKESLALTEAVDSARAAAEQELAIANNNLETGMGNQLELVRVAAKRALAGDQQADALATYRMAQIGLAHALGNMELLLGENKK